MAKDQAFQLVMCEYEKANQSAAVDGVLDRVLAAANGQNPPVFEDVLEWFLADFTDLAVGFKDRAFRDEREVRLGSEEGDVHFEAEKTREGPLMPIPYVEFDISDTWPITEIVVGPTPYPEAAMEAVWHLFMSVRKVPPQIRKSEIPIRSLR